MQHIAPILNIISLTAMKTINVKDLPYDIYKEMLIDPGFTFEEKQTLKLQRQDKRFKVNKK